MFHYNWCVGLPSGACPNNRCDIDVRCRIGDLLLCPDCDNEHHRLYLESLPPPLPPAAVDITVNNWHYLIRLRSCTLSTKSVAQSLGLCKVRTCSTDQSRSLVTDNAAVSSDDVPLPLPWHNRVNRDNQTGTCPLCRRDDIHVVNSTGLLRQHGPRGNECSGSQTQPYPGTLKQASRGVVKNNACQISSAPTNINLSTAAGTSTALTVEPAVTSTSVSTQQDDAITHPPFCSRILKHIPKGARPAVANLLTKLIVAVLQSPLSSSNWTKLLGFAAACLAKPSRGGKSRNLTTQIVKQIRQYELGEIVVEEHLRSRPRNRTKPAKTHDETIAAMAAVKLEDGDVKGAVRLLCSSDSLAAPDQSTFTELGRLHPSCPTDRRSTPSSDAQSLEVMPPAVKSSHSVVLKWVSGGSRRPATTTSERPSNDNPLLVAVSDLINLLADRIPPCVRGPLFGANLLVISKKNGGIRQIAVGYVWRQLAAKVAFSHVKQASAALLAPKQVGYGVAGGAEAAILAAKCFMRESCWSRSTFRTHSTRHEETRYWKPSQNTYQSFCHSHVPPWRIHQSCSLASLCCFQKKQRSREIHSDLSTSALSSKSCWTCCSQSWSSGI